jgi:hypothetical protein
MAVSQTRQEAERNKMPPELRNWLRDAIVSRRPDVSIQRFHKRNEESGRRGWVVYCQGIRLNGLPDGYQFGYADDQPNGNGVKVQIRES